MKLGMGLKVVVRAGVRKWVGMGDGLKLEMELMLGSQLSRDRNGGGAWFRIRKGFRVGDQARFTPAHCPPGRP